jgi:hypothetical protein
MKPHLAKAAAKRLDEQRILRTGPLAAAQKALWEAMLRGDKWCSRPSVSGGSDGRRSWTSLCGMPECAG